MLTRMKSGAHRSVLCGWKSSTFEGWNVVNIILGITGEIHPGNPGNPAFRVGNSPFWPYRECLKKFPFLHFPPHEQELWSCSPLFTWETTPLSHVGKASRAPCVKAVALKSQGFFCLWWLLNALAARAPAEIDTPRLPAQTSLDCTMSLTSSSASWESLDWSLVLRPLLLLLGSVGTPRSCQGKWTNRSCSCSVNLFITQGAHIRRAATWYSSNLELWIRGSGFIVQPLDGRHFSTLSLTLCVVHVRVPLWWCILWSHLFPKGMFCSYCSRR